MSLRILLMRFGIAAAGGALVALAVTTPAIGDDREGSGQHKRAAAGAVVGQVTARNGLVLRTAPIRGGSVVRVAPYGEHVWIHCKIKSEKVDGNSTWYLLKNHSWAWGPARYITTKETPRWCR